MSSENPLSEREFASAVELLRELLPDEELNRLQPCGPATVYTTMVTLWMMTLQRLGGGKTLNAIVKDVLAHSQGGSEDPLDWVGMMGVSFRRSD